MLLAPMAMPVAVPVAPILTIAEFELVQVAVLVRFCVLPSLNVPVAVNCTLVPLAIDELLALIVIDCRVAPVTVSAMGFEGMPLSVAVMLVVPAPRPLARPLALIVATEVFEEIHVTEFVTLVVEPSLSVPMAVN